MEISPTRERVATRYVLRCEIDAAGLVTGVHTVLATRKLTRVRPATLGFGASPRILSTPRSGGTRSTAAQGWGRSARTRPGEAAALEGDASRRYRKQARAFEELGDAEASARFEDLAAACSAV
jgi:hypothetical protein